MSSVQSFPRQRMVGNTAFNVNGTTVLYILSAGSDNVVGNYPPGTMVSIGQASALNSYFSTPIFRDMGKTITAALANGSVGAFRAVQLVNPVAVASATAVTNFGVNGSAPGTIGGVGDDGYNTFYIAISLGGVVASGATVDTGVGPIAANVL
jgi:hypothetical protein